MSNEESEYDEDANRESDSFSDSYDDPIFHGTVSSAMGLFKARPRRKGKTMQRRANHFLGVDRDHVFKIYKVWKAVLGHCQTKARVLMTDGFVEGLYRESIWGKHYYSFEGIPYAKPPVGKLRFLAPVPIDPWTVPKICKAASSPPVQMNEFFPTKYYRVIGSEDCLYLNVYTNEINNITLRPVMVFLYGGDYRMGQASREFYGPDYFMQKNVVIVTLNYRLGVLGFLSLSSLWCDCPGNAGIKDIVMALKFIKRNIRFFGGNPNNITLFGHGSGAVCAHMIMLSEHSRFLIKKVILMSGTIVSPFSLQTRTDWPIKLAKKMLYDGPENDIEILKFLRKAKAEDLVIATDGLLCEQYLIERATYVFGPSIEAYPSRHSILTRSPYAQLLKPLFGCGIPLMIGGTSGEGMLYYPQYKNAPETLDKADYDCLLPADVTDFYSQDIMDEFMEQLKINYFGKEGCNREKWGNFLSLLKIRDFWHPIYRTVRARMRCNTTPTYLYRFDFESRTNNIARNVICGFDDEVSEGVCHGDDLCYLFHSMFSPHILESSDCRERHMIRFMTDIFVNFALTGTPYTNMLGEAYFGNVRDQKIMECLNISHEPKMQLLPELYEFHLWNCFYEHWRL